jgi:uncharacterized protein YlaN (UPF0358 family)
VTESNLARSLFSSPAAAAPRKKIVRTETSSPQVEVDPKSDQKLEAVNVAINLVDELERKTEKIEIQTDIQTEIKADSEAIAAFAKIQLDENQLDDWLASEADLDLSLQTESEAEVNFKAALLEIELETLKQEIATLRQNLSTQEAQNSFKQEYVAQLEAEILQNQTQHTQALRILTAQLEQSESTAKDLQASLGQQIEQNYRQHAEMMVQIAEIEQASQIAISQAHVGTSEYSEQIESLQHEVNRLTNSELSLREVLETTHWSLSESAKNLQSAHMQISEAQRQKEELESQLSRHLGIQALLQQSLQSYESDQSQTNTRVQDLESQVRELQEQILKQAGQGFEYEAAVQHWKEQSVRHQHHAIQLSAAIERLLESNQNLKLSSHLGDREVLSNEIQQAVNEKPLATTAKTTINLPAFLVRSR